jgi:hypothetical protein
MSLNPVSKWIFGLARGAVVLPIGVWLGNVVPTAHAATPALAAVAQVGPAASAQTHHVLLAWHPQNGYLLAPAHAIYRKPGLPGDAGPFELVAIVQPSAAGPYLELHLSNASVVGYDLAEVEQAIDTVLGNPPAGASLAEKIALAMTTTLSPANAQLFFDFLPRQMPPIAMVLGRALLVEVSSLEPSTFEVREYNPATATEGVVVASLTTGLAPAPLSAPGDLSERIETNPRGHLRVLLRWCTPVALAKQSLHVSGYNLYRARRADWQAAEGAPPPLALSPEAFQAALSAGLLVQVNRGPILPDTTFSCLLPPPPDLYFVADDNDSRALLRHEDGGQPFEPGEAVAYYVAALDHFRRPGLPGPGLEVVICDRMPPLVPRQVRVENRPRYDDATDQGGEDLVVSWDREIESEVSHYWVYRWNSHDDALRYAGNPTIANLLARVPNTGAGARLEFVDDGTAQLPAAPPPPTLPGDAGRTFWYTVRGEDDTFCKSIEGYGNLSGPCAPAFGVLRDWRGPSQPGGRLTARCCTVDAVFSAVTGQLSNQAAVRVQLVAGDPRVRWAQVREGLTGNLLAQFHFDGAWPTGFPTLDLAGLGNYRLEARFGTDGGHVSPWSPGLSLQSNSPVPLHVWTATVDCAPRAWPCNPGFADPVDPDSGEIVGVCGEINPDPGAVEWRVYRRTETDGRLVQIESGKFPDTAWCDSGAPAAPAVLCYYVQLFDADGNPSAIVRMGCVASLGTEPLPKPEITSATVLPTDNDAPVSVPAAVEWFCPPPGLERFELALHPPPAKAPSVVWMVVPGAQEVIGTEYGVYLSPRIPAGFGAGGSEFAQELELQSGVEYRVRVRATRSHVADNGVPAVIYGPWSDEVLVSFVQGVVAQGPEVPWPARPVPGINPGFVPRAEYDPEEELGKVEIGTIVSSDVLAPGTETAPAQVRGTSLLPYLTVPAPFVAYRHDTSPGRRAEMTQISPLIRDFLVTVGGTPGNPVMTVTDRFIMINRRAGDPTGPYRIWLRDTQPVMRGKSYRYTLVLHRADHEIADVLASNVASVPE